LIHNLLVQNLTTLASAVLEIVGAHQNLNGSSDLTTPLSGTVCCPRTRNCYDQQIYHIEVSISTHFENIKGDTNVRCLGSVRDQSRSLQIAPFDRYVDFSRWQRQSSAILDFQNFKLLTTRKVQSVNMRHRTKFRVHRNIHCGDNYGHLSIFQDGGLRHLGFLKLQIFNGRTRHDSWVSNCVTVTDFVAIG